MPEVVFPGVDGADGQRDCIVVARHVFCSSLIRFERPSVAVHQTVQLGRKTCKKADAHSTYNTGCWRSARVLRWFGRIILQCLCKVWRTLGCFLNLGDPLLDGFWSAG